jgi:hypothetical protein
MEILPGFMSALFAFAANPVCEKSIRIQLMSAMEYPAHRRYCSMKKLHRWFFACGFYPLEWGQTALALPPKPQRQSQRHSVQAL